MANSESEYTGISTTVALKVFGPFLQLSLELLNLFNALTYETHHPTRKQALHTP